MVKSGRLGINVIFNVILTLSQIIIPIITFPYISRVLLPEGTGIYDFLNSFIGYFSMFAMLGVSTYAIKACAVNRDNKIELTKTVHEILILTSISTLIAIICLICCMFFIEKINNNIIIAAVIAIGLFSQTFGMSWLCSAMEQYAFISIKSLIFNILNLILIFIFVKNRDDLLIYAVIVSASTFLSNVTNVFYLKKYFYFKPQKNYNLKKHILPLLIFFCFTLSTTIYTNIDRVMIGFMLNDEAVGLYSASYKICHIISTVIISIGAVLLPRLSYYISQGRKEEFFNIIRKAVNIVLVLAVPSIIYFEFYAADSVLLFLGDNYAGSITSMQILLPTILLIGLSNLIGIQYLVPLGKEKHVMFSTLIGAVVDVVLNASLIYFIGIEGTAIGTLVAEFSVFLYQFIIIGKDRKEFIKNINIKTLIYIFLLTVPMLLILKCVLDLGSLWNFIISVLCFGVFYIIALLLSKNEIVKLALNIFRRQNKTSNKSENFQNITVESEKQNKQSDINPNDLKKEE